MKFANFSKYLIFSGGRSKNISLSKVLGFGWVAKMCFFILHQGVGGSGVDVKFLPFFLRLPLGP